MNPAFDFSNFISSFLLPFNILLAYGFHWPKTYPFFYILGSNLIDQLSRILIESSSKSVESVAHLEEHSKKIYQFWNHWSSQFMVGSFRSVNLHIALIPLTVLKRVPLLRLYICIQLPSSSLYSSCILCRENITTGTTTLDPRHLGLVFIFLSTSLMFPLQPQPIIRKIFIIVLIISK